MAQIDIRENPHFPGIEIKMGDNQYSRHSHIHKTWSLSYVLCGKTVVSLGTWQSVLEEDQFIAVPSGVPHLCSPDANFPFGFVVIYIPDKYLDICASKITKPRVGKIDSSVVFDLIDLFIQAENKNDLESHSEKLKNLLDEKSSSLDVEWGMNLLDKGKELPLQYQNKSRFQLYRHTRKLFGVGHKKISTIEKMEQAKELMSEGQDLVDVALKCGFYDQSHFSKVFKLYTGLTPTQYLKK